MHEITWKSNDIFMELNTIAMGIPKQTLSINASVRFSWFSLYGKQIQKDVTQSINNSLVLWKTCMYHQQILAPSKDMYMTSDLV